MGVAVAEDVATAGGVVSVFHGRDGQNNDDLKYKYKNINKI